MGCRAANIDLSEEERAGLGRLVRALSTPQQLALRARIILLASDGVGIEETAERLGVWRKTVSCWRKRWHSSAGAPRCGGPARITVEQVCAIIALACEPPATHDLPLSHWSADDLAREAVKRDLVDRISPRQAGRFLKRSRSQAPFAAPLADAQAGP